MFVVDKTHFFSVSIFRRVVQHLCCARIRTYYTNVIQADGRKPDNVPRDIVTRERACFRKTRVSDGEAHTHTRYTRTPESNPGPSAGGGRQCCQHLSRVSTFTGHVYFTAKYFNTLRANHVLISII